MTTGIQGRVFPRCKHRAPTHRKSTAHGASQKKPGAESV